MKRTILTIIALAAAWMGFAQESLDNTKVDGYRSIWFELGKPTEYGVKYSGGFATYTAKHSPLAIYAPEVDKTFFVYGGTPSQDERHLLCMAGCFDHKTGMVCKPTVVYDKQGVKDPHDNPAILLDAEGYVWVYVSGRSNKRLGRRYRSTPRYVPGKGHFLFFTRYDGVRQLFYQTSPDGVNWTDYRQIASIKMPGDKNSGHYQIIGQRSDGLLASAFNRHLNGNVDTRTNIYYIQTADFGETWTLADGTPVTLPITKRSDPSLILDAESEGLNIYIKDVNFDADGHPVILYVSGRGFNPGPKEGLREWHVAHWTGKKWEFHFITNSTHNYDTGSIWTEGNVWRVIAPTDDGAFRWYAGGEVVSWVSRDRGKHWKREYSYTKDSPRNHGYVRRVKDGRDPFVCLWSDSVPNTLSICKMYFADSKGHVWELPYTMTADWEKPAECFFE